jgi:hypothetical protein
MVRKELKIDRYWYRGTGRMKSVMILGKDARFGGGGRKQQI